MVEKRYLLYPDFVTSQSDGQSHFISATDLARLYGVPWDECVVYRNPDRGSESSRYDGLISLSPRYDGDYRLPEAK
ncbi:MAG: hypothetical protein KKA05_10350 [Alphaproteobacteria bacterium]|nr:hypothetical protein [Alphaproteobacteria bacterium]